MNQRIVCAANKLSDGTILLGIRHWDMFIHDQMDMLLKVWGTESEISLIKGHEQGFADQFGKFLTRKEAYIIAKDNGQIIRDIGYEADELYSEHLY